MSTKSDPFAPAKRLWALNHAQNEYIVQRLWISQNAVQRNASKLPHFTETDIAALRKAARDAFVEVCKHDEAEAKYRLAAAKARGVAPAENPFGQERQNVLTEKLGALQIHPPESPLYGHGVPTGWLMGDFIEEIRRKYPTKRVRFDAAIERALGDLNASGAKGKGRGAAAKRRGRPKADYKTAQREAEVAADWARARECDVYKVDFAKQKGMTTRDLDRLLNRVAKRKVRSDK